MGRLNIPIADHRQIRRVTVRPAVEATARKIAAAAADKAGAPDGYKTETRVGTDRVRVDVWPDSPKAIHAEIKSAVLMQVAATETSP